MTTYINGGLHMNELYIKETNESNFDPLLSMLKKDSSVFGLITALASTGFIFKLDVSKQHSMYTEYKLLTRSQEIVTHFALKFVVIAPSDQTIENIGVIKDDHIKPKRHYEKFPEHEEVFVKEAKTQQDIWQQTYFKQGGEIAPSVGNITFLQGSGNIIKFLNDLQNRPEVDAESYLGYVINFLKNIYQNKNNEDFKLGIILMKNYKDSKPFYQYYDEFRDAITMPPVGDGSDTSAKKKSTVVQVRQNLSAKKKFVQVRQNLFIKILRLALLGFIHLDLHAANSLCSDNSCVIIDYGIIVSIKDQSTGNYTMDKYKEKYETLQINDFLRNLLKERNQSIDDTALLFDALFKHLKILKLMIDDEFKGVGQRKKTLLFSRIISSIVLICNHYALGRLKMEYMLDNFHGTLNNNDLYCGDLAVMLVNENKNVFKMENYKSTMYKIPPVVKYNDGRSTPPTKKTMCDRLGNCFSRVKNSLIRRNGGSKTIKKNSNRIIGSKLKLKLKFTNKKQKQKKPYNKIK